MTFPKLPIPDNAVVLTETEKARVRKYLERAAEAREAEARASECLSDICLSIAFRAGRAEAQFKLSADLSCLIPEEN